MQEAPTNRRPTGRASYDNGFTDQHHYHMNEEPDEAVGGDNEANEEEVPFKYRRRAVRLRPVLPRPDWMICPNMLAYLMSWYGLFIGKFPVQIMSLTLGLAVIFAAGLTRITVAQLKTEDFLPTDSPSIKERTQTIMFDFNDLDHPSTTPSVVYPPIFTSPRPVTNATTTLSTISTKRRPTTTTTRFLGGNGTQSENSTFSSDSNGVKSRTKRQAGGLGDRCRVNSLLIVARRNVSDPSGRSYNLYEKSMLREIELLENIIYSMGVEARSKNGLGGVYRYEARDSEDGATGVCTINPSNGECGGFTLRVMRGLFKTGDGVDPLGIVFSRIPGFGLTWPHYRSFDLSSFFGRVETVDNKPNGMVKHVGAMREVFCVNDWQNDYFAQYVRIWEQWEKKLDETMRKYSNKYFDVYWICEYQKQAEQNYLVSNMLPKLVCTFVALMLWCAAGALFGDAVRSKPWPGFIGILSTMIACLAGFGICLWQDPNFNFSLLAVPLLTLAIGLDDMFIMLEAWSGTNPNLPIEERMMLSMNVGGTSIVITFFINLLDFVIGNYTPFPIIQQISEYAIATMVFDFFCQMTIFAPCLVLFGRPEYKNKHSCCCCVEVPTREKQLLQAGCCSLLCCAGGSGHENTENPENPEKMALIDENDEEQIEEDSAIVRGLIWLLSSLPFRIFAMFLFAGYLAAVIWSISQMGLGLKAERVFRENSNIYRYTQQHRLLFTGYGKEVTVVITNELDYALPETRRQVLDMIDKVESCGYFWTDSETNCWVRTFLKWANEKNFTVSSLKNNTDLLYQIRRPGGFLDSNDPLTFMSYGTDYAKNIRMTTDGQTIIKSRFTFRARDMTGPKRQIGMMQTLRSILQIYAPEMQVYAYMDDFPLYDQFVSAVPATIYYCGMTLGVTLGVAVLMIPHPACLFWLAIFVSSVLIGIVGSMQLWDMDLDSVSLINLLIAISFCSDLIAHPVYIFMISPVDNPDGTPMTGAKARVEKAKAVIHEVLGAAIPACVGTTLSVIAMSTSDAYIFIAFFRVMFLSVILSILHALIFVPAFLSFIGPSDSRLQVAVRLGNGSNDTNKNSDEELESSADRSSTPTQIMGSGSGSSYRQLTSKVLHDRLQEEGRMYYQVGSQVGTQQQPRQRRHESTRSRERQLVDDEAPFVLTQPRRRVFRMRGGLGALKDILLQQRRHHHGGASSKKDGSDYYANNNALPTTIARFLNDVEENLMKTQQQKLKFKTVEPSNKRPQQLAPTEAKRRSSSASRPQTSSRENSSSTEQKERRRLQLLAPPMTTDLTDRLHRWQVPKTNNNNNNNNNNNGGFGPSGGANGGGNQHQARVRFSSPTRINSRNLPLQPSRSSGLATSTNARLGANMLPARQRFNM